MLLTRRHAARALFLGAAASLLAACQSTGQQAAPAPTPVNPLIKPRSSGAELTAVLASSELAVGRNRFALGLIDARSHPITTGRTLVEFFKLRSDGTAEKRDDATATFRSVGGVTSKGIWVSGIEFGEPGPWGAQVTSEQPNEAPKVARVNFEVRQKFSAPGYNEPAPRSTTQTVAEVGGDASRLCSNRPPCNLHELSIASALDGGQKPLVVVFATPALCTSATCGPELDAVLQLQKAYGERANFVHVDIYEHPFDGQKLTTTVEEWRLPSEPWTFVLDRDGIVRDRFEGSSPAEEVEPALRAVLT
jgi:hypothetical protein